MTKVFHRFTRTVDGISVVPRLRAWKQPELKLHNISRKKSKDLQTYLPEKLSELSSNAPKLRFNTDEWFLYIHFEGKVRNKKRFVLRLRDIIVEWLSQHK